MRGRLLGVLALLFACRGSADAPTGAEPPPATAPATAPATPPAEPPKPPPIRATPPADYAPPDARGFGRAGGLRTLEVIRGGATADTPLPLVVVVHGLGGRAHAGWLRRLNVPARLVMPEAPIPYGRGFSWFEYRVRDDDPDALARGITSAAAQLGRAIETLARERPTRGKPIVTGFSQGGMLSYALALSRPQLLSLAAPISGLLPPPLWPTERGGGARAPPIRALHGDADTMVPIDAARALVERLRALGYDATLGEHQGVGHTVTPTMEVELVANVVAAMAGAH